MWRSRLAQTLDAHPPRVTLRGFYFHCPPAPVLLRRAFGCPKRKDRTKRTPIGTSTKQSSLQLTAAERDFLATLAIPLTSSHKATRLTIILTHFRELNPEIKENPFQRKILDDLIEHTE